jgi:hypothetical protein
LRVWGVMSGVWGVGVEGGRWNVVHFSVQEHLPDRNVQRFRGGIMLKAQTFISLNSRLESNTEAEEGGWWIVDSRC